MKLLDTVALLHDLEDTVLPAGSVGVLVEELEPCVFEVESQTLTEKHTRWQLCVNPTCCYCGIDLFSPPLKRGVHPTGRAR